jgi:BirA family biotin operon repressor/biotin-[acetyl-CoA-carboxylase] ligase
VSYPDAINPATLAARWGVPRVELLGETDSTNDVARALGAAGAPAGTVVLADAQRAGRGRAGRAWQSPPGLGVWLSLLLRGPSLPEPTLLPLLVGLGAARALDGVLGAGRVRIKWPTDLLVEGRKLGGILCEASWEGSRPAFVVAGIGINVLHEAADFPAELRESATSLRIAGAEAPARLNVAGAIVRAVRELLAEPLSLLDDALGTELDARDALRGMPVVVTDPADADAAPLEGVALGVAPDGALLVRASGGALRTIRSGTVRLLAPAQHAG